MSYDSIERSIDLGAPVYLYEFRYGEAAGAVYRYAGTAEDITAAGAVWEHQAIKHGEISMSGNLDRAELAIRAVEDIAVSDLFRASSPSTPVVLTIFRGHVDLDDFIVVWTGRVLAVEFDPDNGEIEFSGEPASTSVRRMTLRRFYQYGCGHVLYGNKCKVSRAAHTAIGVVTGRISSREITIRFDDKPYSYGNGKILVGGIFRVLLPDGRLALRAISWAAPLGGTTNNFQLRLISVLPEIYVGLAFELQRGCQHNWSACKSFDNLPNFGGCPNIPERNPFVNSIG